MRSIVESIANAIVGNVSGGVDVRVFNEVILRALLNSIYRGAAPEYSVKAKKRLGNILYSYDIVTPGLFVPVPTMREAYAATTLSNSMYSSQGQNLLLDALCRYIVSICAFLPEYTDDMISSIGRVSDGGNELVGVVRHISRRMQEVFKTRMGTSAGLWINWGKLQRTYYDRLYLRASYLPEQSLAKIAYAVFSGRACSELTKLRDDLVKKFSESSSISHDEASELLMKLALLSNFSAELSGGFSVHISRAIMNLRGQKPHVTVLLRPKALLGSLSKALPHTVQDSVNETIRRTAPVNAEMLLMQSMLFDNRISISADKIGGLRLDDGTIVFSFSKDFSFPLLGHSVESDFTGDIITSRTAQNLVDLLIESHHLRERCSFHVSYDRLAEEIRDLHCRMEATDGLREHMLNNMCKALFGDKDPGVENYGNLRRLVDLLGDRVRFLNSFVDSPDYKHLADFLVQSSSVDNYADFAVFLDKKRRAEEEESKKVYLLKRQRTFKFLTVLGEIASVAVIVTGVAIVLFSFYYLYIKEHGGVDKSVPFSLLAKLCSPQYIEANIHVILISGIVVAILGFLSLALSWISSTSVYKTESKLAAEAAGSEGADKPVKCKFDKSEYLLSIPYGDVDLSAVGLMPGEGKGGGSVMELGWRSSTFSASALTHSGEEAFARTRAVAIGRTAMEAVAANESIGPLSRAAADRSMNRIRSDNMAALVPSSADRGIVSHANDTVSVCSSQPSSRKDKRSQQIRKRMNDELRIASKKMMRLEAKSGKSMADSGEAPDGGSRTMDKRLAEGFKSALSRCRKRKTNTAAVTAIEGPEERLALEYNVEQVAGKKRHEAR